MEKLTKKEKVTLNIMNLDWVFAGLLALEYFWGKIPFVTNFFYVFGWVFYILILLILGFVTYSYFMMVFTDKYDDQIKDQNDNGKELRKKFPVAIQYIIVTLGWISTILVIIFGWMTAHYFFAIAAIFILIMGKIMKLPCFTNVIQRKLTKNLLLNT